MKERFRKDEIGKNEVTRKRSVKEQQVERQEESNGWEVKADSCLLMTMLFCWENIHGWRFIKNMCIGLLYIAILTTMQSINLGRYR